MVFERDNLFTKFLEGFYQFDTNTNVCPSIHVIGSVAVMICGWNCKSLNTPGWRIFLGYFRIFDFHIHRFFKAALGTGYFCGNPGLHCRIPRRIRERQEKRKETYAMKQKIEIRSLKKTDKKELSRLLRRQEGYDDFFYRGKRCGYSGKSSRREELKHLRIWRSRICGWPDGGRCGRKQDKEERRLIKNTGKILLPTAENEKEKPGCAENVCQSWRRWKRKCWKKTGSRPSNLMSLFPVMQRRYQNTQISGDPFEPLGGLGEST